MLFRSPESARSQQPLDRSRVFHEEDNDSWDDDYDPWKTDDEGEDKTYDNFQQRRSSSNILGHDGDTDPFGDEDDNTMEILEKAKASIASLRESGADDANCNNNNGTPPRPPPKKEEKSNSDNEAAFPDDENNNYLPANNTDDNKYEDPVMLVQRVISMDNDTFNSS